MRAAALAAVAIVAVLGVAPVPAGAGETPTTETPVMGPNLLTAAELADWYDDKRGGAQPDLPALDDDIEALAKIFIAEGRVEGVRGDIAFVQSALETAWFTFPDYGQIRPEFNNYAGINAFDGREKGTTCEAETAPSRCFETPAIGVRNQIHLLRGYADATSADLDDRLRLPPADRVGLAPLWELFGGNSPTGKLIWASADDYGVRIIELYSAALVFNGANPACLPYSPQAVENPSGQGYWLVTADGEVHAVGEATDLGDVTDIDLNQPLINGESNHLATGYWLLALDGGVFTYGGAKFFGSAGDIDLNQPINGMERTDSSQGYWLVAFDGGIFSYGNARFFGSTGSLILNAPVLGMERTETGLGYWLFALDGGIFAFGDARFYGSLGNKELDSFVISMQRTATGNGYWMLDAAGNIYAFGDAKDYGDVAGCKNYGAAARLLVSPSGGGYWIATTDGSIIPFGDARRLGMPAFVGGRSVALMGAG